MNTKEELIEMADNAYYATEYEKAIELYLRVLEDSPKNKHAQIYLKNAERNQSLNATPPQIPTEAIQLYKRSRSFIAAGDLTQAKKFLSQAISITKKAGGEFRNAEELLANIETAYRAEELKKEAYLALETQQWSKALDNLDAASRLDPTDETTEIELMHLQNLVKAQNLITQLNAGGNKSRQKNSKTISEIQEIINQTNEVTMLSKLWQDVVRELGKYNDKNKARISQAIAGIVTVLVIASGILGGISAQNYWSPGAYIALAMLAIALVISVFTFTRR